MGQRTEESYSPILDPFIRRPGDNARPSKNPTVEVSLFNPLPGAGLGVVEVSGFVELAAGVGLFYTVTFRSVAVAPVAGGVERPILREFQIFDF
jgi:hypothetical protein